MKTELHAEPAQVLDRCARVCLHAVVGRLVDVGPVLEVVVSRRRACRAPEVVDRERSMAALGEAKRELLVEVVEPAHVGQEDDPGLARARRVLRGRRRARCRRPHVSFSSSCETDAPAIAGTGGAESRSKHMPRRYCSGSSARMRVPPPGGLCTSSEPSSAATRSPSPRQARAGERVGAALPVVLDDDHDAAVALTDAHRGARRLGVLRDVRQGFRDDVVGGDRDVGVERRVRDVELDRDGRAGNHDPQRGRKSTLRQRGRMDALRERAKLLHRLGELLDRQFQRLRLIDEPTLRSAQLQEQREQPLLRAVVEVALETASRVVGRSDDPGTRPANLGLVTLALRHVRAADQVDRAARDLGQRRARPDDIDLGAVALEPPPLALARGARADRREDAVTGAAALAVRDVLLPEQLAAGLVRRVAEHLLECAVRGERPHPAVAVDEADQARRVVRDRIQELALALELRDALAEDGGRLLPSPAFEPGLGHQAGFPSG